MVILALDVTACVKSSAVTSIPRRVLEILAFGGGPASGGEARTCFAEKLGRFATAQQFIQNLLGHIGRHKRQVSNQHGQAKGLHP